MKYARTGTKKFVDADGDSVVFKEEPTGSQFDQRVRLLGGMRIPAHMIDDNSAMGDLFKSNEMLEINMDKEALAEYQFKTLFVEMCLGGRTITAVSEAVGEYRRFDQDTKKWIDEQCDSIWKAHDDNVTEIASAEGESAPSLVPSSEDAPSASGSKPSTRK
jgi:hypothetical protein